MLQMWNLWILPNQTSRPTKTSSSDRSVGCIIIACINWWLGTIFHNTHRNTLNIQTQFVFACAFICLVLSCCLAVSIVKTVFFFLSLLTDSVVTIAYLMSFVAFLHKKQIEKLT